MIDDRVECSAYLLAPDQHPASDPPRRDAVVSPGCLLTGGQVSQQRFWDSVWSINNDFHQYHSVERPCFCGKMQSRQRPKVGNKFGNFAVWPTHLSAKLRTGYTE